MLSCYPTLCLARSQICGKRCIYVSALFSHVPPGSSTTRFGFHPISLQDGLTPTLWPLNPAPPHFSLHRQLCNSLWLTKASPPAPISSSWPPGSFQCQQRGHVTFHAFLLHVYRSTYIIRMCIYGFFFWNCSVHITLWFPFPIWHYTLDSLEAEKTFLTTIFYFGI